MLAAHRGQALGTEVMQAAPDGSETAAEVRGDLGHGPAGRRQQEHLHPVTLGRGKGRIAPQGLDRGAFVGIQGNSQHASTLP
jgi:hypothetical protein